MLVGLVVQTHFDGTVTTFSPATTAPHSDPNTWVLGLVNFLPTERLTPALHATSTQTREPCHANTSRRTNGKDKKLAPHWNCPRTQEWQHSM